MSERHRIEELLRHPSIWRAGGAGTDSRVVPSGFAKLDAILSGGWPLGCLIELLADSSGIGELRLLLPGLVRHCRNSASGRWVEPLPLRIAVCRYRHRHLSPSRTAMPWNIMNTPIYTIPVPGKRR